MWPGEIGRPLPNLPGTRSDPLMANSDLLDGHDGEMSMSLIECSPEQSTIPPEQLHALHQSGKPVELIDVRTPAEYRSLHAAIARVVPLDELNPKKFMESRRGAKDEPMYVICRSGARGEKACDKFLAAGCTNVVNVAGGHAGLGKGRASRLSGARWMLPLDRQVQTTAGTMALSGFTLGELVQPQLVPARGVRGLRPAFRRVDRLLPAGVGPRQDALESGGPGREHAVRRASPPRSDRFCSLTVDADDRGVSGRACRPSGRECL